MDLVAMSETVAGMLATGAVEEAGATAASGVMARIARQIRSVFGEDHRAVQSLDQVADGRGGADGVRDLASALRWYAERNEVFAAELRDWAASARSVTVQRVEAGRDAFVAGRDQTVISRYRPGK